MMIAMKMKLPPHVQFHRDVNLMVFRPLHILDEKSVNVIVDFLEKVEDLAEKPFNRFTDLSKLDAVDLDFGFVLRVSLLPRQVYGDRPLVQSAFYVTSPGIEAIVKIHAAATDQSPLQVAIFKRVDEAAKWLNVSREALEM